MVFSPKQLFWYLFCSWKICRKNRLSFFSVEIFKVKSKSIKGFRSYKDTQNKRSLLLEYLQIKAAICISFCMLQALLLISDWNYHLKKSQQHVLRTNERIFFSGTTEATFHLRPSTHDAFFFICMRVHSLKLRKLRNQEKLFYLWQHYLMQWWHDTPFNFNRFSQSPIFWRNVA